MRVVCMVPSWTETLIRAGVDVVGRTRFCVHPRNKVASIPTVGGTKELDWDKVSRLHPDLLVLDREENPRWMAHECPVPWMATHVRSVAEVDPALRQLHERLWCDELLVIAERWRQACAELYGRGAQPSWSQLPGVISWVRRPGEQVDRFVYLVWKDPWMAVGPDTFVGSMLNLLGFGQRMVSFTEPSTKQYPQIRMEDLDPTRTLLLCASEPYPFGMQRDVVEALPFPAVIVDGECFSWFGVRALQFLEDHLAAGYRVGGNDGSQRS